MNLEYDNDRYIFNENDIPSNESSLIDNQENKRELSFLNRKKKCSTKDLTSEETIKLMYNNKKEDDLSNSINNDNIYTILNLTKVLQIEYHIDSQKKNQDKKNITFEDKKIQTEPLDSEE